MKKKLQKFIEIEKIDSKSRWIVENRGKAYLKQEKNRVKMDAKLIKNHEEMLENGWKMTKKFEKIHKNWENWFKILIKCLNVGENLPKTRKKSRENCIKNLMKIGPQLIENHEKIFENGWKITKKFVKIHGN